MNHTKTFLSGVALCALATAPALAGHAPKIQLVSVNKSSIPGHVTGVSHSKTNIVDPRTGMNTSTFVTTIAEHYSIHESTAYNVTLYTGGWTWVNSTCAPLPHQKLKVGGSKHGVDGKFTTSATVGCATSGGGTIFGFGPVYFPTYKLTSTTATKDKEKGQLTYKASKTSKDVLKLPITFTILH